jgi:pyruvate dehydrogenase E2 component (dihydrolipoamide acetyltransferase)
MALIEVRIPDLGSFKDVAVIELLVRPGDRVEVDAPLATLETEKATMDVPSSAAGVVETLAITKGSTVNTGDLVATLKVDADAALASAAPAATPTAATPPAPSPGATPAAAPPAAAPSRDPGAPAAARSHAPAAIPGGRADLATIDEAGFSRAHAGPSVRRLARELGVDLGRVTGSGLKGRITHDDVKSWVKRALSAGSGAPSGTALPRVPTVDFAAFGPVELRPLSRVQRISGPRLHASWVNLPHVTQFDESDVTELEAVRNELRQRAVDKGIKLTPLAFVIRACALALAEFPLFNSSLDERGENLVIKKYCHVGFAADTPQGLLVPVIRDADRMDVYEIARSLGELSEKARAGKLSGAEMQGGTFTVSSLGGIGGTAFTPVINAPEVAILGVSRSALRPVWKDGAFVPRLVLPLSLSYDHRVIDGAAGVRFTTWLSTLLSEPRRLLEAVP